MNLYHTQLYAHDNIQKTTEEDLTGTNIWLYTFVSLLHNHILTQQELCC